jgi:hypothetical protein
MATLTNMSLPLSPLLSSICAGILSGVAGLVAFLVVHHLWIKPIWFIALPGLLIAAIGGAAIGWSYFHLREALPARPWTSVGVFALIMGVLAPAIALSFTHGPLFDLETATIPAGRGVRVAIHVCLELLLTATIAGGVLGWWLTHSPRAAFTTAIAGLAFAVGPGHNVPFFGTTPAAFKGFALLAIIAAVSAIALVESEAALRSGNMGL